MTGRCPKCKTPLELPQTGAYQCRRCRLSFQAYLTPPRPPAPAPALIPGGGHFAPYVAPGAAGIPSPVTAARGAGARPSPLHSVYYPPAAVQGACAAHPANPAIDLCERCGDFMCAVCQTVVEGRRYCPRCFDILYARGALRFTHRTFQTPMYSFGMGVGGLASIFVACGLLSPPAGILAILFGIQALREIARRPDLPGRTLAIWGIVTGVLNLLFVGAGLAWMGYMIWRAGN